MDDFAQETPTPRPSAEGVARARLLERFKRMFGCDTARISTPGTRMFLIIGYNRNTRDGATRWFKNGEPVHFDYVQEKVIASGETARELLKSAREYKRLLNMTCEEYFRARSGGEG